MNIDTGEIRPWGDLTEAEKASGKWVDATPANLRWFRERQAAQEQREHNRQVRREAEAKANPTRVAKRIEAAVAKRQRKAARSATSDPRGKQ